MGTGFFTREDEGWRVKVEMFNGSMLCVHLFNACGVQGSMLRVQLFNACGVQGSMLCVHASTSSATLLRVQGSKRWRLLASGFLEVCPNGGIDTEANAFPPVAHEGYVAAVFLDPDVGFIWAFFG